MGNITLSPWQQEGNPAPDILHPDGVLLGGWVKPVPAMSLDQLMNPPQLGQAGASIDAMARGQNPSKSASKPPQTGLFAGVPTADYSVGPVDMPQYHFYPDRLEIDHALLGEPRVQALMATIRGREGPEYDVIHGGQRFDDYSRHPNIKVNQSTAAGAYQFNYPTWNDQKKALRLPDFAPQSQDLAAVDLLHSLHATDRLLSDDVDAAIFDAGQRWQSLPTTMEHMIDRKGRARGINHPVGGKMAPTNTLEQIRADYLKNLR